MFRISSIQLHRRIVLPALIALAVIAMAVAAASMPATTAANGLASRAAATTSGTIAYIPHAAGATGGNEIHLIQPDGSGDHVIYKAPTIPNNQYPLNDLAWSPDGTRLAFHSTQENACSVWDSDIYTIYPDGTGIKRLTNPPTCADLAAYPQGSVRVTVENNNFSEGFYLVYIQGARDTKSVTVPSGSTASVVFDQVADFGPGVTQLVEVTDGPRRWIPGNGVDVQSGATVDAGVAQINADAGHRDIAAKDPTWRSDSSALAYAFVGAETVLWIPVNLSPSDWSRSIGTDVFPSLSSNQSEGLTADIAWSPAAANVDQFLYVTRNLFDGTYGIWQTTVGSNSAGQMVVDAGTNQVVWVNWLPDGSGFVFSVADTVDQVSAIYVYDLASKQSTAVYALSNEYVGEVSAAPDGQSIVFERTADLQDPNAEVDAWIVRRDGSNPHQLVANAIDPVWSLVTPKTPPPTSTYHIYLPAVFR